MEDLTGGGPLPEPVRLLDCGAQGCFLGCADGFGEVARGAGTGSSERKIAWLGSSNDGSFSGSRDCESQGNPFCAISQIPRPGRVSGLAGDELNRGVRRSCHGLSPSGY